MPIKDEGDLWRFIADRDGTVIELSGGEEQTIELNEGEFFDLYTPTVFWASGNVPYSMVHFMSAGVLTQKEDFSYYDFGADCNLMIQKVGDPTMAVVYPYRNWLHRYVLSFKEVVGNSWCHNHITIVTELDRWDEVTLNGQPLDPPQPLGDSGLGGVPNSMRV